MCIRDSLHGVHGIAVTNVISHAAAFILIVICLLKSSLELNFRKKSLKTLKCIGNILPPALAGVFPARFIAHCGLLRAGGLYIYYT